MGRPSPAPARVRGRHEVLILGAGIGGLNAAYELGRAGFECEILEAQHRAGGRNFTARRLSLLRVYGDLGDAPQGNPGDPYAYSGSERSGCKTPYQISQTLFDDCAANKPELKPLLDSKFWERRASVGGGSGGCSARHPAVW